MTDPRQTADPEICAQWDWCPYCKNGLDTGLQCDQCLADLMPVQEALRELQRLRSPGGASNEQNPGTPGDERRLAVGAARVEGVGATASLPEPSGGESSYRRMFEAACSSLGEIAKEAGVPEEHADDGPEAILDAIRALKQRVSPEPSENLYTTKDVEALLAIRDAAFAAHAAKPVATAWMRNGVMENAFPRPPRTPEEWADHDSDGYWSKKGYSELPLYVAPPSPGEPAAGASGKQKCDCLSFWPSHHPECPVLREAISIAERRATEPSAGQPPKAYRLQDRLDPTRYVEYNPGAWDLILIPMQPLDANGRAVTKGDK